MSESHRSDHHAKSIAEVLNLPLSDVHNVLSLSKFMVLSELQLNAKDESASTYSPYGSITYADEIYQLAPDVQDIRREQEHCLIAAIESR